MLQTKVLKKMEAYFVFSNLFPKIVKYMR